MRELCHANTTAFLVPNAISACVSNCFCIANAYTISHVWRCTLCLFITNTHTLFRWCTWCSWRCARKQ
jgi:hypothetical protein